MLNLHFESFRDITYFCHVSNSVSIIHKFTLIHLNFPQPELINKTIKKKTKKENEELLFYFFYIRITYA